MLEFTYRISLDDFYHLEKQLTGQFSVYVQICDECIVLAKAIMIQRLLDFGCERREPDSSLSSLYRQESPPALQPYWYEPSYSNTNDKHYQIQIDKHQEIIHS